MTDVKKRPYDSPARREQARANRRAMLEAAIALLVEQGYAATTLAEVAEHSGLSAPAVYKAFGNKPTLVKAAFDYAAAGDDDPTPVPQRDRAARILAEPDPVTKLEIYTEGMLERLERVARLQLIARAAAAGDAEVERVWQEMSEARLRGMAIIAANLAEGGHLRDGVDQDEARDVLWTYNSPELYELLVLRRGWNGSRYRDWVLAALVGALLPD
ncbi:MAG: TetR/AcrR family transcriptional regulator [Marmoricola sp.]